MKKLVSFVGTSVIALSLMVPSLAEARGHSGGHSHSRSTYHPRTHAVTHSSPSHDTKTTSVKPKADITKTPSGKPKENLTKNTNSTTDSTEKKIDKSISKKTAVSLSKTPKAKSVVYRNYNSPSNNFFNLFSGASVFGHSNGYYYRPYYTPYYGYHSFSTSRSMIGQEGIVVKTVPAYGTGIVDLNGRQWSAGSASGKTIQTGMRVVVKGKNGNMLSVEEVIQ